MPVWLFVLYIAISIIGAVVAIGIVIFFIKNNRRLEKIYQEKKQDNAIIHEKCMIRNGIWHRPGVAQVIGDELILYSSLGKNFRIPLAEVQVKREFIGRGWYMWFGKTVFCLDTPYTWRFAIAVHSPEPWRTLFDKKVQISGTPSQS